MKNSVIWAIFFLLFLTGQVSVADDKAPSEADTPLFVMLFDQHCKVWCGAVRPILHELQQEYQDRARYAELDTTPSKMKETMIQAKHLEISGYIPDALGNVPEVLVFKNHGRDMVGEISGVKDKKAYKAAIEKALNKK